MDKDISRYFFRKYEKAGFRVPFGHWPDFKTKEEVDEWLKETERMTKKLVESRRGIDGNMDQIARP